MGYKRKRLPYTAVQQLDAAQMDLADAARALAGLLKGEPTSEEMLRRVGLEILHVKNASDAIQKAKNPDLV